MLNASDFLIVIRPSGQGIVPYKVITLMDWVVSSAARHRPALLVSNRNLPTASHILAPKEYYDLSCRDWDSSQSKLL